MKQRIYRNYFWVALTTILIVSFVFVFSYNRTIHDQKEEGMREEAEFISALLEKQGNADVGFQAAAGKTEIGMEDFLNMLGDAIDGVKMRGHSDVEEATMLDAMVPSLNAMKEAFAAGKTTKEILDAGVKAAWAGAEHTKGLVATKGRASYVGERGLGHQDPGATSYAYTLQAIASNYC